MRRLIGLRRVSIDLTGGGQYKSQFVLLFGRDHYEKTIIIFAYCINLTDCGQSDKSSSKNGDAEHYKLVGVSQQALIFRELSVPTEKGSLNVTCYLDDRAKEVCKGEYANGESVPADLAEQMLTALQVDPGIGIALNSDCKNKTLLLSVEPKLDIPEADSSEFCFWTDENNTIISCNGKSVSQAEAEAINNRRLEKLKSDLSAARESALEAFTVINPNLVSEAQKNAYASSLYGALDIKHGCTRLDPVQKKLTHFSQGIC